MTYNWMARLVVAGLASGFCLQAAVITESFDNVPGLAAKGWSIVNNSSPIGVTDWFQGNAGVFPAQSGAGNSYIAANFLAAGSAGAISDWLLSPVLPFANGDTISFYTRTQSSPAVAIDQLELRLSLSGASGTVGSTPASVGAFTTLLLTVNPGFSATGYPGAWTQYTATLSGIPAGAMGRAALHYVVNDTSINGDYIGVDTFSANLAGIPESSTLLLGAAGLLALAAAGRRHSNGSN
jgi:hypothetical protein